MWKVVVALLVGGSVLALVLMTSSTAHSSLDGASASVKEAAKKIQAAVTGSSSVSASTADLAAQGIRIEGTAAAGMIAENERADAMNAMADEIDKADAAKQAALLAAAKALLVPVAPAATTTAATTTDVATLEAELRAYDLGKASAAEGFEPYVGFEHAACG